MVIKTRSQQNQSNTSTKSLSMQLPNNAKPQYQEEKEAQETEMEMKTNDLIHFLKSESSCKIVILNESNIQMIGDDADVIPKFLVEQIWDNMEDMYVEDARVPFQDIDSVGDALVASFAESLSKEDCNDECVQCIIVIATSAIVNMDDKPLSGSLLSLKNMIVHLSVTLKISDVYLMFYKEDQQLMEQFMHKNQEFDLQSSSPDRTVARCFGYYDVNVDDNNGISATENVGIVVPVEALGDETQEYTRYFLVFVLLT